jgi:20S proteasome subunit alpha 6
MYRNQYDTDVTTFSPAGRLHQVEYAGEAVKQGSACVALRSKEIAVVVALKRSPNELAGYQKKVFKIDDHMGIGISGLIADARTLAKYMRNECLNHKWAYESPMQTQRLVTMVSDKAQVYTQKQEKRPYGVGLLVIGYDKTGPHVFETSPSGVFYEYKAQAMGARSQSARTYLEKNFESFDDLGRNELVRHALLALKGTAVKRLTSRNCTVAFVGKDIPFTCLEDDDVRPFLEGVIVEGEDVDAKDELDESHMS